LTSSSYPLWQHLDLLFDYYIPNLVQYYTSTHPPHRSPHLCNQQQFNSDPLIHHITMLVQPRHSKSCLSTLQESFYCTTRQRSICIPPFLLSHPYVVITIDVDLNIALFKPEYLNFTTFGIAVSHIVMSYTDPSLSPNLHYQ